MEKGSKKQKIIKRRQRPRTNGKRVCSPIGRTVCCFLCLELIKDSKGNKKANTCFSSSLWRCYVKKKPFFSRCLQDIFLLCIESFLRNNMYEFIRRVCRGKKKMNRFVYVHYPQRTYADTHTYIFVWAGIFFFFVYLCIPILIRLCACAYRQRRKRIRCNSHLLVSSLQYARKSA